MKTITISVVAMVTLLALVSVVGAQDPGTVRSAGTDLLAGLVGDMVRFERGMRTLEDILSKNPNDLGGKSPAWQRRHGARGRSVQDREIIEKAIQALAVRAG